MLSTVGATGTPGTLDSPGCRGPISPPVRTSAAFTIAPHLLRWPGQVRRFPHLTRPVLVHLFEPKFGRMSSRYSMFVRRYRGGLTFRRGPGAWPGRDVRSPVGAVPGSRRGELGARAPGPRSARHKRQTSIFMLFRRNVSVCVQGLEGLYF